MGGKCVRKKKSGPTTQKGFVRQAGKEAAGGRKKMREGKEKRPNYAEGLRSAGRKKAVGGRKKCVRDSKRKRPNYAEGLRSAGRKKAAGGRKKMREG
jgi:hypothetical protein